MFVFARLRPIGIRFRLLALGRRCVRRRGICSRLNGGGIHWVDLNSVGKYLAFCLVRVFYVFLFYVVFSFCSCFCVFVWCLCGVGLFDADAFDAGHFLGVGVFVFVDEEVEGVLFFSWSWLRSSFIWYCSTSNASFSPWAVVVVVGQSLHSVVYFAVRCSIDELEVGGDVSTYRLKASCTSWWMSWVLGAVLVGRGRAVLGAVLGGRGAVLGAVLGGRGAVLDGRGRAVLGGRGAVLVGRGRVGFFVDGIYSADGEEFFVRWVCFGRIFRMDGGLIVGGCIFIGTWLAVCFGLRKASLTEESGEFEESVVVEA